MIACVYVYIIIYLYIIIYIIYIYIYVVNIVVICSDCDIIDVIKMMILLSGVRYW